MKITLVRHGEVDRRYLGAYNGHIDISLSHTGHAQALALAQKFQNRDFDAYFCSDLLRAKETLAPLHVRALYSQKLREKSWGAHEGMRYEEIVQSEGIGYKDFYQWLEVLDGENYLHFIARVKKFFYEELPVMGHEDVFIMTHSGVIRVLHHLHKGISLEEAFSLNVPYAGVFNFELTH